MAGVPQARSVIEKEPASELQTARPSAKPPLTSAHVTKADFPKKLGFWIFFGDNNFKNFG